MRHFIIAFAALVAVVNASGYGGSAGYGGSSVTHHAAPPAAIIPGPAVWNQVVGPLPGPALNPIGWNGHISGHAAPSSLISIGSNPSAAATASSANVPLTPGSHKLWVVPSWVVANVPGKVRAAYGAPAYGAVAPAYGAVAPAYSVAAPAYAAPAHAPAY